jgi:PAS domain S-box-containing protein
MPSKKAQISAEDYRWIHEHLFHQVPFNVAVIDRDYNIVDANKDFHSYFGEWRGKKCYAVYKKLSKPCPHCTIRQVFEDGKDRVNDVDGIDQRGRPAHYVGHCIPLRRDPHGPVEYVVEMSVDVTATERWQREYNILFDRVPCYVTVIDEDYRIVRANEAFREQFGDVLGEYCYEVYKRRKTKCRNCPAAKTFRDGKVHRSTQKGVGQRGQEIHYSVSTSPLMRGAGRVAHVIEISSDITPLRKLEHKIIEAERLSAVGQTVAGLAHSIKNILMGLEGGKYIVSLGLKKEDKGLLMQGWEMLDRNLEKTTSLVKDFLNFAKGKLPQLRMVDPAELVEEIVTLYKDTAKQSGITLRAEVEENTPRAPLDPEGIHTCLTNLVSNAIDACLMGEQKGSEVVIRVSELKDALVIEVEDNGSGIDCEIKKKIFTTFFTTKGGEGTGLGLLTTRKIVQEHGGSIAVESQKGRGSRFRMEFPRKRLNLLYEAGREEDTQEKE